MSKTGTRRDGADDDALLALFRAIASGDHAKQYFLAAIHHYVYRGDTALHIAAASHQRQLVESLVGRGADPRARNRSRR